VTGAWFAVLESIIVAGGKSKADVERDIREIVPPEQKEFVHIFRLKG
jgi:hypothetical protein